MQTPTLRSAVDCVLAFLDYKGDWIQVLPFSGNVGWSTAGFWSFYTRHLENHAVDSLFSALGSNRKQVRMPTVSPSYEPFDELPSLYPRLVSFAHRQAADLDSEDLVQDAMLRFVRWPPKNIEPGKLYTLLCGSIVWEIQGRSKRKKTVETVSGVEMSQLWAQEEAVDTHLEDFKSKLPSALQELDATTRRILLCCLQEKTFKEIASELNCHPRTVSRKYHQALADLERLLE